MLLCSLKVTTASCAFMVVAAGCATTRDAGPIRWRSIEPQQAEARVPERQPEQLDYARFPEAVVHHPDNREPVDPIELPYRCIGRLMIYYPDGTVAQSTAFLVGPEHILTAADGFVGPAGLRKFNQAVFTPALHGDRKPYGSASVVKVVVPTTFVEACDQIARDIAVVSLDRRIGDEAGYLTFDFAVAASE